MSSLQEAIDAEPRTPNKGPGCAVSVLRGKLEGDDQAAFDGLLEAIRQQERTAASVGRILTRAGHKLNSERIRYHMNGLCKCPTA